MSSKNIILISMVSMGHGWRDGWLPPHRNFRSPLCPDESRLGTPDSTSKRFGLFRSPSAHPASSSGCLFLPGETSNWRQTYLRSTPLSSFLCTQPDLNHPFSLQQCVAKDLHGRPKGVRLNEQSLTWLPIWYFQISIENKLIRSNH